MCKVRPPEPTHLHRWCDVHACTRPGAEPDPRDWSCMGRRSRTRNRAVRAARARDHQARVRVSDEDWQTFRVSLGGQSIAEALGGLVEREVSAYRRRLAQRDDAAADEMLAALQASRELQAELATIVDRFERLAGDRKQREHER